MKYAVLILLVAGLFSCHNYKKDTERLQTTVDSLKTQTVQKDSTINVFINDFSEIQSNLDSIKHMEASLNVSGKSEKLLNANQKEKILSDIATINGLLKDNKDMIASLRRRLHNSNLKTGKLESMVNDLEARSKSLEDAVKQKDALIAQLNEKVEQQSQNIDDLNTQVAEIEEKSEVQMDSLKMQETALNKAYYTVGTVSKLKDEGVVKREGGILGIGSVPVVKKDFDQNNFTKIDLRDFKYLPLTSKKAEVISVHPIDSYHLSGNSVADTLYVDNPKEFWSASKYLVVVTK